MPAKTRKAATLILLLGCLILWTPTAFGDLIVTGTIVDLTEGTTAPSSFSILNNGTSAVTINNLVLQPTDFGPDLGDFARAALPASCFNVTIAAGGTINCPITITTSTIGGTTDTDFGRTTLTLTAGYFSGGSQHNFNGTTDVYVVDPGGATPEPASMILFGSGLLGLAITSRRKLFR